MIGDWPPTESTRSAASRPAGQPPSATTAGGWRERLKITRTATRAEAAMVPAIAAASRPAAPRTRRPPAGQRRRAHPDATNTIGSANAW